jgi:xanthine phosphoribosyltransferase
MTTEPHLSYIPHDLFVDQVRDVAAKVTAGEWGPHYVIGVGRGGLVPAVYLSHLLRLPMLSIDHSSNVPSFAEELLAKVAATSATGTRVLFVDDINDSGGTIATIRRILVENGCDTTNIRFCVLINNLGSQAVVDFWAETIDRAEDKRWFVFPWEAVEARDALIDEARSVPERLA